MSYDVADSTYGFPELGPYNQLTRELMMVRDKIDPHVHFPRACNLLLPTNVYEPNRWGDDRAESIWDDEMTCWWGPGASTKTTDAARAGLAYWMAAPHKTAVICCSTTADMLDKRIWGEMKRMFLAYKKENPQYPAELYTSNREIRYKGETERGEDTKNVIRGVAILQGTLEEALGNVIGLHNDRVMLIIDEAQASREALVEARINLRKGARDFRILLIGNPTSRLDPLGRYSEPVGGYHTIDQVDRVPYTFKNPVTGEDYTELVPMPRVRKWKTKYGTVRFYPGFDAPSLDSPEEARRLHFMIQRSDIEKDLIEYGPEHPRVYTYTLGWLPPEGMQHSLYSFKMFAESDEDPVWRSKPQPVIACDPSFSLGGDDFIIRSFLVGRTIDEKIRILCHPPQAVKFVGVENDEELEDFCAKKIVDVARRIQCPARNIAVDCSGNHLYYASLIERGLGEKGVLRMVYQSAATDLPLSEFEDRPANDMCKNQRAEMWALGRYFLRHGHLAHVDRETKEELVEARLKVNSTMSDRFIQLEDKVVMKQRTGRSPDKADAFCMAMYLIRHVLGVTPGSIDLPAEFYVDYDYEYPDDDAGEARKVLGNPTYAAS